MLSFVQNLRLSSKLQAAQLTAIASEIYREYFAQLVTVRNNRLGQEQVHGLTGQQQLCHSFDVQISNQNNVIAPTKDDVWIFGYGSLVWKADFPYIDRRRGYVCGFKRRFYQHSIDHRGVPEKPGRVVTLLPGDAVQDQVYGVAYRIAAAQKQDVLDHLDYREKNGYERCKLQFHEYPRPKDTTPATQPIEVIMYVATQTNESYAGDVWEVPRIAEQIFTSAGPSGPNREYLFNLAIAMRDLFPGAVDEHLTELVGCVQNYIEQEEPALLERAICKDVITILSEECLSRESKIDHETIVTKLEALQEQCKQPGWRESLLTKELQVNKSSNNVF